MPRPDPRRPREGQYGLFESEAVKEPGKVLRGRHSIAIDAALDAARDQGLTDAVDEALLTVIRASGWSLDAFESQNKPYGPSKVIDPLVNALREAGLTPSTRLAATNDAVAELMKDLISDHPTATTPHAP